jgi:hypothetical protein
MYLSCAAEHHFFFLVIFGLQDLIVLLNCLQLSLSNDIIFQSFPGLTFSTSSLSLSSHRNLGRPNGLFSSTEVQSVLSRGPSLRHAWSAHVSRLTAMPCTILGFRYSTFSFLFFRILHSPVYSSLHGPCIFLNTFLSIIPGESVFRSVRVSDPTTGCINVRYIWIFKLSRTGVAPVTGLDSRLYFAVYIVSSGVNMTPKYFSVI